MRTFRLIALTVLLMVGMSLANSMNQQSVLAQGENLLANPSFEGEYSSYVPASHHPDCPAGICTTAQIPAGWQPWWVKERPSDANPEYKPATAPFLNRIRSGDRAAQYFSFYKTHKAGFYQQVTVPANANVRFSVWGQAWSTDDDAPVSVNPVSVNMRIGLDPTGGADVYNPAIIWSGFQNPYDVYQQFVVEGRAQGTRVTVFMFSAPDTNPHNSAYGLKHTDIYWDDAALVVIGQGSAPPPAPAPGGGGGNPPPPAAAPIPVGPTATPNAEGVINYVVQSGDSMWSIAARAGISLDQLLAFNGLSRESFIQAGQTLVVGEGSPSAAAPVEEDDEQTAVEDNEGDTEGAEEAAAAATPAPPPTAVPTPVKTGGDICLIAFDDANQNGLYDAGESLRASVAFTISDGNNVVSNYVTTGVSEPKCIEGLEAGNYHITRSQLSNEQLTTPGDWAISLTDGSVLNFEFGSYISDAAIADAGLTAASTESSSGQMAEMALAVEQENESAGGMNTIVIVAVILALLLLVGVLVVILSARRTTL